MFEARAGGGPVRISRQNLPRKNYMEGANVRRKFHNRNFNRF